MGNRTYSIIDTLYINILFITSIKYIIFFLIMVFYKI